MTKIEFAKQRLEEELYQQRMGADNQHYINYWRAYLDGAIAQQKEDAENRSFELTNVPDVAGVIHSSIEVIDNAIGILSREIAKNKAELNALTAEMKQMAKMP